MPDLISLLRQKKGSKRNETTKNSKKSKKYPSNENVTLETHSDSETTSPSFNSGHVHSNPSSPRPGNKSMLEDWSDDNVSYRNRDESNVLDHPNVDVQDWDWDENFMHPLQSPRSQQRNPIQNNLPWNIQAHNQHDLISSPNKQVLSEKNQLSRHDRQNEEYWKQQSQKKILKKSLDNAQQQYQFQQLRQEWTNLQQKRDSKQEVIPSLRNQTAITNTLHTQRGTEVGDQFSLDSIEISSLSHYSHKIGKNSGASTKASSLSNLSSSSTSIHSSFVSSPSQILALDQDDDMEHSEKKKHVWKAVDLLRNLTMKEKRSESQSSHESNEKHKMNEDIKPTSFNLESSPNNASKDESIPQNEFLYKKRWEESKSFLSNAMSYSYSKPDDIPRSEKTFPNFNNTWNSPSSTTKLVPESSRFNQTLPNPHEKSDLSHLILQNKSLLEHPMKYLQKVTQMKDQKELKKQIPEAWQKENTQLHATDRELQAAKENEALQQKVQTYQKTLKELQDKNIMLQSANTTLTRQNTELQTKKKELEINLQNANDKLELLSNAFRDQIVARNKTPPLSMDDHARSSTLQQRLKLLVDEHDTGSTSIPTTSQNYEVSHEAITVTISNVETEYNGIETLKNTQQPIDSDRSLDGTTIPLSQMDSDSMLSKNWDHNDSLSDSDKSIDVPPSEEIVENTRDYDGTMKAMNPYLQTHHITHSNTSKSSDDLIESPIKSDVTYMEDFNMSSHLSSEIRDTTDEVLPDSLEIALLKKKKKGILQDLNKNDEALQTITTLLREESQAIEKSTIVIEETLHDLILSHNNLSGENNELTECLSKTKLEIKNLMEERDELRKELSKLQANYDCLALEWKSKIDKAKKECTESSLVERQSLKKELQHHQNQVIEMQEELDLLRDAYALLMQEHSVSKGGNQEENTMSRKKNYDTKKNETSNLQINLYSSSDTFLNKEAPLVISNIPKFFPSFRPSDMIVEPSAPISMSSTQYFEIVSPNSDAVYVQCGYAWVALMRSDDRFFGRLRIAGNGIAIHALRNLCHHHYDTTGSMDESTSAFYEQLPINFNQRNEYEHLAMFGEEQHYFHASAFLWNLKILSEGNDNPFSYQTKGYATFRLQSALNSPTYIPKLLDSSTGHEVEQKCLFESQFDWNDNRMTFQVSVVLSSIHAFQFCLYASCEEKPNGMLCNIPIIGVKDCEIVRSEFPKTLPNYYKIFHKVVHSPRTYLLGKGIEYCFQFEFSNCTYVTLQFISQDKKESIIKLEKKPLYTTDSDEIEQQKEVNMWSGLFSTTSSGNISVICTLGNEESIKVLEYEVTSLLC